MINRYIIVKSINCDRKLYAVIDYHRDLLICWCTSLKAAESLCNSFNVGGADYE